MFFIQRLSVFNSSFFLTGRENAASWSERTEMSSRLLEGSSHCEIKFRSLLWDHLLKLCGKLRGYGATRQNVFRSSIPVSQICPNVCGNPPLQVMRVCLVESAHASYRFFIFTASYLCSLYSLPCPSVITVHVSIWQSGLELYLIRTLSALLHCAASLRPGFTGAHRYQTLRE